MLGLIKRLSVGEFMFAFSWGALILCAAGLFESASLQAQQGSQCKANLLMEASSGDILEEFNSRQPLPPASMVKMMTAYVVLKRIQEGLISESDIVTTSATASRVGGSQVYLKHGEQFSVKELLEALLVQSANDAAVALAEHVAGDSAGFVEMMNAQARTLGMSDTLFVSPHGLPPSPGQKEDFASARDLAILGRALIREFPGSLALTGISEAPFRGGTFGMRNHNPLVRTFPGCDGIKTGYHQKAGFGVTATASRNGMRMIAVVMGCEKSKIRDGEAARLLSVGFARYHMRKLVEAGTGCGTAVPVSGGDMAETEPVTAMAINGLIRDSESDSWERKVVVCDRLEAPVARGTPCGSLTIFHAGRPLGSTPLIVASDIPKAGLIKRTLRWLHVR